MKKIICLLTVVVMCLGLTGCGKGSSDSGVAPKEYELGGDSIQSFTTVVGARRFEGADTPQTNDGSAMYMYHYSGVPNVEADARKYRDYLLDNQKFNLANLPALEAADGSDETTFALTGKSVESDKRLTLLITYSEQGKTVDIAFTKDSRTDDMESTKTVGKDGLGFLCIPEDWRAFNSVEGTPTLISWARDPGTIVHLDVMLGNMGAESYAVNSANNLITQIGKNHVKTSFEEMDGHKAYYIASKHPNDAVLLVWYFDDDDGTTHYVAAESKADDWKEVYNIAHTFRLKN